ncbi:conserved hypothetical protein [Nitrosococcus halophilus Nc 4]|uniref:DUF2878 domain-containing protein n=1 Tax=Nitrosococcus halophilus (strain Nc4) TaxID=472759 RepID=D5BUV4_NITHN|nr:DUF2878 domain-containing protein [Nitrosococcus halophilus]ADE13504.1 conserved hypothetical protein [Nitrosococcus halophilus Nc 4]
MAVLINLFAFQVGWLACVLGGAYQLPWLGTTLAAIFVGLHVAMTRAPRRELRLILLAGVIGTVWDSFLVTMGWLHYPSGTFMVGMAPHWIIALWMLFACTLNVSLRWLKGRWWLATASGALAGPLPITLPLDLAG